MGYSPKHAKPVSLRGTALKTPLTVGAGSGPGRHRAGTRIPTPRFPGDESVPASPGPVSGPDVVPDPVTTPSVSEETAPAAKRDSAPGHAEEAIAAGTRSKDRQSARAEALTRFVPLQRAPLAES